jgi:uncharacterized DUF497 family protein
MIDLGHLTGFDWDESKKEKNWEKHGVLRGECEEVFFNLPLLLQADHAHFQKEPRYYVLGHTTAGRRLFIAFTVREDQIRVISARDIARRSARSMSQKIPHFKNEEEEREFWSKHDSSEYLNWKSAERVLFPNLKPSTRAISLRLPESLLDALRQLANERDVPYQSLIKMILQERIEQDFKSRHRPRGE